jgi:hypothetical protein
VGIKKKKRCLLKLVNFFTNAIIVNRFLNQKKETAVSFALTEQYLAHQFKKIKVVVKKLTLKIKMNVIKPVGNN